MIGAGELRKGIALDIDGTLYQVLDYRHIKMARGSAQVRLKLRDLVGGHTVERTFQANDRFTRVRLERRPSQYLYSDGHLYHFMDSESYEQSALTAEQLADVLNYLKEGMAVEILTHGEVGIAVELSAAVDLRVADTGPGIKGDTAQGGTKPATLETGLTIQVPLFVNVGDVIKVDTRSGTYLERVS